MLCLVGSGWLHATIAAVLGGHLITTSPKSWGLCHNWTALSPTPSPGLFACSPASASFYDSFNARSFENSWGCSFTSDLSQAQGPSPVVQWHGLAALYDTTWFQNQFQLGYSYTTMFDCQHEVPQWLHLEHSFHILTHILMLDFFLNYC